jgi:hypothetical protein
MRGSVLVRIDSRLYSAIKDEQERLSDEYRRPVSFAQASRVWYKKAKDGNFNILGF